MKIRDTLHLSVESFRNRKSRTFLTMLGVSVGIGAVLFLVSLGYGLQKILLDRITTTESFLTLDVSPIDSKTIALTPEAIDKISKIPNVSKVSPQAIYSGQVSNGKLTAEASLSIVNPDFLQLNGTPLVEGHMISETEIGTAIINVRGAELFNFKPKEILGQKISLSFFVPDPKKQNGSASYNLKQTFEVVGVLDEGDSSQVYIDPKSSTDFEITEYQFTKVKVTDAKYLNEVREVLISRGFSVASISDIVDQANKIFRIIQLILGIFGVVAVVVAAISLANTMTISLLERTQDIGVMMSIGASGKDIRNLFLIESTVIGFAGGVTGILLGMTVAMIVNGGMRFLAHNLGGKAVNLFNTPFWFVAFIMIFSTGVGFITGIYPALRAGKLNPLQALKYK